MAKHTVSAGRWSRRRLLVAPTAALAPAAARAQTAQLHRVALLGVATRAGYAAQTAAFRAGMRALGYVEGANLTMVELPTRFEYVVSARTARTLGFVPSPSLLARARIVE